MQNSTDLTKIERRDHIKNRAGESVENTKVDNKGIPPLAGLSSYGNAAKPGYPVNQNVGILKRYHYVKKMTNKMISAHFAKIPEWEIKCAFGLHLWLDAEHASLIRKRISEMREPPLFLERVPDPYLELFFAEAIRSETSIELLAAIFRVIRPELIRSIRKHLAETNPVADHPTVRMLKWMLFEEEDMARWGEQAMAAMLQHSADREAADKWEQHLAAYLRSAGGFWGDLQSGGMSLPEPRSDGSPYRMDPVPRRDERFQDPFNASAKIDEYYKNEEASLTERTYALLYKRLREMDVPEFMGAVLYKTEGKPWEYYADLSRQMWDETRHGMLGEIGIVHGGVPFYKYPIDMKASVTFNSEFTPQEAHLALWAIEQHLMHKQTGKQWEWEIVSRTDNVYAITVQDYDWADEVLHAQIGRKWLVPDFANMEAAIHTARQINERRTQLFEKTEGWSGHSEWWPAFMAEVANK